QLLEAFHLGLDVIGLDVEMYTTGMVDPLHLDVQLILLRFEQPIARVIGTGRLPDGMTQRLAPEAGSLIQVIRTAIDDKSGKSALVHSSSPWRGQADILTGQQNGFRPGKILRMPVDHDDIAIAQDGITGGLPPQYSLPPHAGERNLHTAASHVV